MCRVTLLGPGNKNRTDLFGQWVVPFVETYCNKTKWQPCKRLTRKIIPLSLLILKLVWPCVIWSGLVWKKILPMGLIRRNQQRFLVFETILTLWRTNNIFQRLKTIASLALVSCNEADTLESWCKCLNILRAADWLHNDPTLFWIHAVGRGAVGCGGAGEEGGGEQWEKGA